MTLPVMLKVILVVLMTFFHLREMKNSIIELFIKPYTKCNKKIHLYMIL